MAPKPAVVLVKAVKQGRVIKEANAAPFFGGSIFFQELFKLLLQKAAAPFAKKNTQQTIGCFLTSHSLV